MRLSSFRKFTFVPSIAVAIASVAALTPATAQAWECIANPNYTGGAFGCSPTACRFAGGNGVTYHFIATQLTNDQEDAVEKAAGAWRAGAGRLNRGADWTFTRGADSAAGSLDLLDTRHDITMLSDTWMANNGIPANALAVTISNYGAWPNCGVRGSDIVFRDSISWSTSLPAAIVGGDTSIGQVAIHEFGHMIGFDHENDDVATMNATYPGGGDISAAYRINEMDYVGLADNFSDSSTGKNLMISKFRRSGASGAVEGWTGATVVTSPGAVLSGANRPDDVLLLLTGTTSAIAVRVNFYLRPVGTTCAGAGSVLVGGMTPTLGVAMPFSTNIATWTVPTTTPPGDYVTCAKIDADDAYSETAEDDNTIGGERIYTVN